MLKGNNMAAPKVLILSHTSHLGGAERVLLRFLAEQNSFFPVLVVPEGPLAEQALGAGLVVERSPHLGRLFRESNPNWPLDLARQLKGAHKEVLRLIDKHQPQILQANGFSSMLYLLGPATLSGLPLVWQMHDIKMDRWGRWLSKVFAQRAAQVVAVSRGVATALVGLGVPAHKIKVIYNHIRPEHLGQPGGEVRFPRSSEVRLVGLMGTLEPRKGMAEVVEAFAHLQGQPVQLWIAGTAEGPAQEAYRSKLLSRIEALELQTQVHLIGPVQHTAGFYRSLDLFLHYPKFPDPLPTVLLEAIALGVPVMASDSGGNPEILGQGRFGRLVPPNQPSVLAKALLEPQPPLAEPQRQAFLQTFSLAAKEQGFQELYVGLLAPKT
ncbi:MAG: hypothetical protein A2600_09780 [Candidatus Lambdaproteobacteria bacterium RIFOXYD1_FULL_56_27]|uniref:Glycosyltransferase subfamily 4-like N-terminal domain-containing protein n=1 Tax=Candidatus Lambdaproteobacteria bacterium RIFOXYD2_FULL_56_26 TaxID=1817773 RepID=A0A1F6GMD4_9PROT|nr:MAG: hypothetical protein A2557_02065 [Candidatus Lambdaproteobacteria bacterium RIFOXYD2_FULL_56_26]OGH03296.1 MAG: hypothetical protein A2426_07065 [Candidatus Lambdaproteobacteria bacterium RIFOXYC1_FULL_56_13]OGH09603.1 MAG: hypothetical protein A2600_09780 [Candidatus Lambdaproteobacteria bacterium RIFOXYD1_FULL_56_27]